MTQLAAPVIDGQGFLSRELDGVLPPAEVATAIAQATQEVGMFQLVNHGIDEGLVRRLEAATRGFFGLPLEEKLKVKRTQTNPNGFFNDELTKQVRDLKEGFDYCHEIGASLPGFVAQNQWPQGQAEFRRVMEEWLAEATRASFKLLQAFCLGLGMPPDALAPYFEGDHTSFCRLNFYPVTPADEQGLGVNHHTDAGFLTILVQDPEVPGLEFLEGGAWHLIKPIPGALTINVGDQAQVLTNDILKAALHRVRSPHTQPRYSAPFFFNPGVDAIIAPLQGCVESSRPAAYRPISWREFRAARFAGDYADLGEEVQIAHYRIA